MAADAAAAVAAGGSLNSLDNADPALGAPQAATTAAPSTTQPPALLGLTNWPTSCTPDFTVWPSDAGAPGANPWGLEAVANAWRVQTACARDRGQTARCSHFAMGGADCKGTYFDGRARFVEEEEDGKWDQPTDPCKLLSEPYSRYTSACERAVSTEERAEKGWLSRFEVVGVVCCPHSTAFPEAWSWSFTCADAPSIAPLLPSCALLNPSPITLPAVEAPAAPLTSSSGGSSNSYDGSGPPSAAATPQSQSRPTPFSATILGGDAPDTVVVQNMHVHRAAVTAAPWYEGGPKPVLEGLASDAIYCAEPECRDITDSMIGVKPVESGQGDMGSFGAIAPVMVVVLAGLFAWLVWRAWKRRVPT